MKKELTRYVRTRIERLNKEKVGNALTKDTPEEIDAKLEELSNIVSNFSIKVK